MHLLRLLAIVCLLTCPLWATAGQPNAGMTSTTAEAFRLAQAVMRQGGPQTVTLNPRLVNEINNPILVGCVGIHVGGTLVVDRQSPIADGIVKLPVPLYVRPIMGDRCSAALDTCFSGVAKIMDYHPQMNSINNNFPNL